MSQRLKLLTIVAFCAFPLALVAALILLWRNDPSAQLKYERISKDMTLEGVQNQLGSAGSAVHPGDTTGKYRFDTKKQYRFLENANPRDEKWWYWRFDDGLIIAAFDAQGNLLWKQFFRRT